METTRHSLRLLLALLLLATLPAHAQLSAVANGDAATAATPATFDPAFTHHTAVVNGVRLHYVIGGKGEPLVLLHGYAETWWEWHRIMPALAQHYTIITPDLRGAGDSDKPYTGYDKKTMAADIYALTQTLGYKRINLVGHDIGMMVAYAYAAAHPSEVSRLALIEAPVPGVTPWDQLKQSPQVWHFRFHSVPNLPEAMTAGRERTYLTTGFYKALAYNPAAITEADIDEYVSHYASPGGMRAGFEYFRAFPQDERDNAITANTKLAMPVLALGGAQSLGSIVKQSAQSVAFSVQGGVIKECGHWMPEEQPEELTRRLLAFFGNG